jgi:hypothetical protein
LESNRRYINLSPKGEPRLGKRGLYGAVGGRSPADRERAMLWVLNQSDGAASILDIAERSGMSYVDTRLAADDLQAAGLLTTADNPRSERAPKLDRNAAAAAPRRRPAASPAGSRRGPARPGRKPRGKGERK